MTYRTYRTFLEIDQPVNLRRHGTRHIETEDIPELVDGIGLEITSSSKCRIFNPLFLEISEIHPVHHIHRCRPCDIFKQFHRHRDRHSVLDTVLQIVEPTWFEVKTIRHADVILRISGVADIHILIPSLLARLTYIFKWIYTIHRERKFWQCHRHDTSERVLAMACVCSKIKQTADTCLICDTRLEGIAQIFIRRYRIVFVIVRTYDIDIGRE